MSHGYQQQFLSNLHRQALSISGGARREFTQAELKIARHMAQDGAPIAAIGAAIAWLGSASGLRLKLKKLNIISRNRAGWIGAHFGGTASSSKVIDTRAYRPGQ